MLRYMAYIWGLRKVHFKTHAAHKANVVRAGNHSGGSFRKSL